MEDNKINEEGENKNENNVEGKLKPELIVIENKKCHFKSKGNTLQDNFKDFRKYVNKIREKKKDSKKLKPVSFKDNPERIKELRDKFVETARSLIGTPYGKKYLIKHPEYKDNFFLDCCGLVRQVVYLMSEDLGFTLGHWNQCYQYDMLPEEIPFEKTKKGDLVFYSADYFPGKKHKKFIHDMVHVEILTGEGEKTIGSRKKDSTVQEFNCYKLKDNKKYRYVYHFKSIDLWLRGILKSHCNQHKWEKSEEDKIGDEISKYSAFNEENDEDEYDDVEGENEK
jgi:hypothetical protein